MKRLFLIALLLASALSSGCRSVSLASTEQVNPSANHPHTSFDRLVVNDGAGEVVVQKVEFRSGVSSATVERLAKNFGCYGKEGAGLLTEKGPVEIYRMTCDNGTVFMAQCELRQCKRMR